MRDFLSRFMVDHYKNNPNERIGQAFVNRYIQNPWPELFYEERDMIAIEMIAKWIKDNEYFYKEPPRVDK